MARLARFFVVTLIVAACGQSQVLVTSTIAQPTTTKQTTIPTTTTTTKPEVYYDGFDADVLSEDLTLVAMVRSDIEVYENPGDSTPQRSLPGKTILGTTTVLPVVEGPVDGWARVKLPVRPNGSEGWIQTDNADMFVVPGRVVIDLSDRRLTYLKNGQEILSSVVAIGTSRNPTPTGSFFVTDNVTLAEPNTQWGPHALGLSGRSDTITEYNGGDGIIGIHGTNRPGSIGQAASLGCVRLPNDVITELHQLISIGTPVEIQA